MSFLETCRYIEVLLGSRGWAMEIGLSKQTKQKGRVIAASAQTLSPLSSFLSSSSSSSPSPKAPGPEHRTFNPATDCWRLTLILEHRPALTHSLRPRKPPSSLAVVSPLSEICGCL